jgi:hypothetical protein
MRSTTNSIKTLASRFASLPPAVRMKLTKKLLDLNNAERALAEAEAASGDFSRRMQRKSFLEQFWDEVEDAHGDYPRRINPFAEERKARQPELKSLDGTSEQGVYFSRHTHQLGLIA